MESATPHWRRQVRVFLTSLAIVMWFYGVTGLLKLLTGRSESLGTFLLILLIALFYLGCDGDLSELVGVHRTDARMQGKTGDDEAVTDINAAAGVVVSSSALA